jgi:hypothetical protein
MDVLAVGVPVLTDPAEGWNFWPLIGIPLSLLLAFRWLKLPRRPSVAIAAVLVGLLIADGTSRWGVIPVWAAIVGSALLAATVLRTTRRNRPPTV